MMQTIHHFMGEFPGWCDCLVWCETFAEYEDHLRCRALQSDPDGRGDPIRCVLPVGHTGHHSDRFAS